MTVTGDYSGHLANFGYAEDLGMIKRLSEYQYEIANRLYAELFPTVLTSELLIQQRLKELPDRSWFMQKDNPTRYNIDALVSELGKCCRRHLESLRSSEHAQFDEAFGQILFMAFLQRIVNGEGRINREVGIGNGRADLVIENKDNSQRILIQLKIGTGKDRQVNEKSLSQISQYGEREAFDELHLLVFDNHQEAMEGTDKETGIYQCK
eukprot:CAMPEP_0201547642 /NCGR_PEP_ID=MMETSP0173_2-20130828/4121_1 /ASSEMBLY_ACC=CAM_ASM_000268 /TAXON_ID=218659 /ORGANISM="Vexillifera sp., Strain DIVA3 564/2" /LENGTH=208 /DNA_ID=CAMNT_0047956757 /DNA_START=112 /DNA_END=735 /DNA_ORIENTATION=-